MLFARKLLGSISLLSLVLALATKVTSCGEGAKEDAPAAASGESTGNVNVKLKTALSSTLVAASEGCSCSTPGTSKGGPVCDSQPQGKCYTPKTVRGHFNSLYVASSRLLGGGNKYKGLESVFRTGFFDFSSTPVFLDGDDTLQNAGTSQFNILDMNAQSIEYQFLAAGKYFNVRIPMVTIPAAKDPKFQGCIDEGGLGDAVKYTKLYADGVSVTAGDILTCIKDAQTDVCKDTDYRWVDSNGELHSERPTAPLSLTGAYAFKKSSCQAGSSHPEVTWGGMAIYASLPGPLGVTAVIEKGKKIYSSSTQTGNTLDVTIAFDMSHQLFVPNAVAAAFTSADYSADGPSIRRNLDKITLRQIYQHNTSTTDNHTIDSDNMGSATITSAISTKEETEDGDVEDMSKTLKPNEGS